jgi:hypothetical protein
MQGDFVILDITAGKRRMWTNTPDDLLFLDRRRIVKPDIVASNEFLPFIESCMDGVVYDPPHLFRHSRIKEGSIMARWARDFTLWKRKAHFLRNLNEVNKEVARVLKADGWMLMKHCDGNPSCHVSKRTVDVLLERFQEVECEEVKSVMHRNTTYWITLTVQNERECEK